jgi:hypothetical protein
LAAQDTGRLTDMLSIFLFFRQDAGKYSIYYPRTYRLADDPQRMHGHQLMRIIQRSYKNDVARALYPGMFHLSYPFCSIKAGEFLHVIVEKKKVEADILFAEHIDKFFSAAEFPDAEYTVVLFAALPNGCFNKLAMDGMIIAYAYVYHFTHLILE